SGSATDHASLTADVRPLTDVRAAAIYDRLRTGQASAEESSQFSSHMLFEMARMSADDGLVMQLHVGSYRNYDRQLFERFGRDIGADIPVATEWTRALSPL